LGDVHEPLTEAEISNFINHSTGDIYTDGQLRLMIDGAASLRGKNDRSNLSDLEDCHAPLAMTVGCIDLFEFDKFNLRAGIGILIAEPEDRKNGYAKEALSLLTNYCFEVLNLRQLFCHITVDNKASLQLFKTCGFEQSGINRDWVKKGNVFLDAVFLQKLNG
jgi:diamine N-acetyltransferase